MPRSAHLPRSGGSRLLITAGPTHEPIDSVRYLGNRSSGRLGVALAQAAARRGVPATLLLGPTHLDPPESSHVHTVRFQTAAELQELMERLWPSHDVLVMAAAVADYRPVPRAGKIRRTAEPLVLQLEPTPDLLARASATARPDQVLIGFAVETAEALAGSAREKLRRKNLHAIVANPLETMEAENITATVFLRDGRELTPAPGMSKADFAEWLLDRLAEIRAVAAP